MESGVGPQGLNPTCGNLAEAVATSVPKSNFESSVGYLLDSLHEPYPGFSVGTKGTGEVAFHIPAHVLCIRLQ